MLLCTSRQRWGYVGLCEPTGEPVEGRLVGVIRAHVEGVVRVRDGPTGRVWPGLRMGPCPGIIMY